jgi:predicted DNA-binding protein
MTPMPRTTTSIRFPEELAERLDRRAAAEGVTRSELVIRAVESALADQSNWSRAFLEAVRSPRPALDDAVDDMMNAIRARRSRSEAPAL